MALSVDQNIIFSRAFKGYDPEEVDAAFDEMQKEIIDLKHRNGLLIDELNQHTDKLQEFTNRIEQVEGERTKESLRLTGLMKTAAQTAEQIKQEARREADEITVAARLDTERICEQIVQDASQTVCIALVHWNSEMKIIKQSIAHCVAYAAAQFDSINAMMEKILSDISEKTSSLEHMLSPPPSLP